MNQFRIQLMNSLKTKQPTDYRKLKKLWKLLLKPREALAFESYRTHRLFEGLITEKGIVDYLINLDPRLNLVYTHSYRLIESIRDHHYSQFIHHLEETRKYVFPQKVRTAFNTLFAYRYEIENSLTYTLSNGVTKGTINKIKMIKRSGYGYRNFGHLRTRIILSTRKQKRSEIFRHIYFNDEVADLKYNGQKIV